MYLTRFAWPIRVPPNVLYTLSRVCFVFALWALRYIIASALHWQTWASSHKSFSSGKKEAIRARKMWKAVQGLPCKRAVIFCWRSTWCCIVSIDRRICRISCQKAGTMSPAVVSKDRGGVIGPWSVSSIIKNSWNCFWESCKATLSVVSSQWWPPKLPKFTTRKFIKIQNHAFLYYPSKRFLPALVFLNSFNKINLCVYLITWTWCCSWRSRWLIESDNFSHSRSGS